MKVSPLRVLNAFLKTAAIQHPPRKLKLFVERLPIKLDKFVNEILDNLEFILDNDPDEENSYFLSDATRGSVRFSDLEYLQERLEETEWGSMKELMGQLQHFSETYVNTDDTRVRKQILGILVQDFESIQEVWRNRAQEYTEAARNVNDEWRDQIEDETFVKRFNRLAKAVQAVADLAQEVPAKLTEQLRLIAPRFTAEPERPASDDVEPLYHTSIKAKQLYQKGFSDQPQQTAGLGGATEGISFTSDLYVAKEIMRALKEAIMIAKGQVKWHEIMDWARREGIKHELEKYFRPELRDPQFDKRDPENAMRLYKAYLHFSEFQGGRYNPLFFMENLDMFRRANPRDVGVIVADVDMTDPDIKYLSAEHEYRVPPRAVQEITKLIS